MNPSGVATLNRPEKEKGDGLTKFITALFAEQPLTLSRSVKYKLQMQCLGIQNSCIYVYRVQGTGNRVQGTKYRNFRPEKNSTKNVSGILFNVQFLKSKSN